MNLDAMLLVAWPRVEGSDCAARPHEADQIDALGSNSAKESSTPLEARFLGGSI